jgi:hypothetical protein
MVSRGVRDSFLGGLQFSTILNKFEITILFFSSSFYLLLKQDLKDIVWHWQEERI